MSDAAKRPFVRVYHEDLMRDYPEVYGDDAALATWLRLLVIADKMWPTRPELPRSARPRSLAVLTGSGLVTLTPPNHYQVRGYQSERQSRQEAARNAAAVRWQSKGNADADADAMPRAPAHRDRVPVPSTEFSKEKNGENRARGLERVADVLPRLR